MDISARKAKVLINIIYEMHTKVFWATRVAFVSREPQHEISNNVICATSRFKASDQPAHTCSLIRAFASRLNIL